METQTPDSAPRACDFCRRKKIKCNGSKSPKKACSACASARVTCTFEDKPRARGPAPRAYVMALHARIAKVEALLQKRLPDVDLSQDLESISDVYVQATTSSARNFIAPLVEAPLLSALPVSQDEDEDEDIDSAIQAEDWDSSARCISRPLGKSAYDHLVQVVVDVKRERMGTSSTQVSSCITHSPHRRNEFWTTLPWEKTALCVPRDGSKALPYEFPEPNLLRSLVNLYFDNVNVLMPLLSRPSFERTLSRSAHLSEDAFARILLLVCALGSRCSEDPRVLSEDGASITAGWFWFKAAQATRTPLLHITLEEIQVQALTIEFMLGQIDADSCWAMAGVALRLAQHIGMHRRSVYSATPNSVDEQWKRAFWVLVYLDRQLSTCHTRPSSIYDEDVDVDLPLEYDDEHWDTIDSVPAVQKPATLPSRMTGFIHFLKLYQIQAFALRNLRPVRRWKAALGLNGPEWEQKMVAELGSALNQWMELMPAHLRWDPTMPDDTFFLQSATLHIGYHSTQMVTHRPFIRSRSGGLPSPLTVPARTLCISSARACSRILFALLQRRGCGVLPWSMGAATWSATIILINRIMYRRTDPSWTSAEDAECVDMCLEVLEGCALHWPKASQFIADIQELASCNDHPGPAMSLSPCSNTHAGAFPSASGWVTEAIRDAACLPVEDSSQPHAPIFNKLDPLLPPTEIPISHAVWTQSQSVDAGLVSSSSSGSNTGVN